MILVKIKFYFSGSITDSVIINSNLSIGLLFYVIIKTYYTNNYKMQMIVLQLNPYRYEA